MVPPKNHGMALASSLAAVPACTCMQHVHPMLLGMTEMLTGNELPPRHMEWSGAQTVFYDGWYRFG